MEGPLLTLLPWNEPPEQNTAFPECTPPWVTLAWGWRLSLPVPRVQLKAHGALARSHCLHAGLCHQQQIAGPLLSLFGIQGGRGTLVMGSFSEPQQCGERRASV